MIKYFGGGNTQGESSLSTQIMPLISGVILAALFVYIFANFSGIAGTTGILSIALPALVPIFGIIGYILANNLAGRDPAKFQKIGSSI